MNQGSEVANTMIRTFFTYTRHTQFEVIYQISTLEHYLSGPLKYSVRQFKNETLPPFIFPGIQHPQLEEIRPMVEKGMKSVADHWNRHDDRRARISRYLPLEV